MSSDLQNTRYHINHGFREFDYRTKITTLLGTKYYITTGSAYVPYGYTKIDNIDSEANIYVNNYSVSMATLYTNYITEDEYESMTPLEKESSLLKTVVLEESDISESKLGHNETVQNEVSSLISNINYEIIDEYGLLNDDNNQVVVTSKKKNTLEIEIDAVKNSEIYLYVSNVEFTPSSDTSALSDNANKYSITAKFGSSSSVKSVDDYKTYARYWENKQMLLNLGYYEEASGTITITFSKKGTYDLSSIEVIAVSMDGYEEDIENLNKSNFEVTSYGNGYLDAVANCEEDGILQFNTLYNKGWNVYVDGEKVNTMTVNKYFLGIKISKGEHVIELKYQTPYLKIGIAISLIGIIIFIILAVVDYKKKKHTESSN